MVQLNPGITRYIDFLRATGVEAALLSLALSDARASSRLTSPLTHLCASSPRNRGACLDLEGKVGQIFCRRLGLSVVGFDQPLRQALREAAVAITRLVVVENLDHRQTASRAQEHCRLIPVDR